VLGRNCHMPTGWILRGPPARQMLQGNLLLVAERKICNSGSQYLFAPIAVETYKHVSLTTLCQSGKKDLLNLRRWERRSFSVQKSFGASAMLQCRLVTCHLASRWLHRSVPTFIISIFKLPQEDICWVWKVKRKNNNNVIHNQLNSHSSRST